MIIRPAAADDAAQIADFWAPLVAESVATFNSIPKTHDDVAEMIATRPCFLVAEDDGRVLGFVTYDQFRGGIGYRHTMEHTIIVDPAHNGRGAGRALMQAAIEHARAADVHALWAGVSAENVAGVAFHTSLGFQEVTVLEQVGRKFDRWMDLVLMQKRL